MTLASGFPDNSGYVVAAYLVFFALLVIYLSITAFRLTKIERQLTDLTQQLDATEERAAKTLTTDAPPPSAPSRSREEVGS